MNGIDRTTGKPIDGKDHLRQSLLVLLTTRIGSRPLRRTYGSRLPELMDGPMNEATRMDMNMATVEAIAEWEPRLSVDRVVFESNPSGQLGLDIYGTYIPTQTPVEMMGLEIR